MVHRPSSQPNEYTQSLLEVERKMAQADTQLAEKAKHEENAIREASLRQANRDRVSSFDHLGRQAQLERQHRLEREKKAADRGGPGKDRMSGTEYPFLSQTSVFSEPSVSVARLEREPATTLLDDSFQSNLDTHKELPPKESLRRLREERQKMILQNQDRSPPFSQRSFFERQEDRQTPTNAQNATLGPRDQRDQEGKSNSDGFSQQVRNVDEGVQNHRSMLALINDNNKRAGRISPLPQAVQGAQGQKRGPSSDPSIKNEFSRMFAGIGSGVGSAGLNSGASTPFPPSPKQNSEADQRIMLSSRGDSLDFPKSRNGSRASKRSRRVKEDDLKDVEPAEDRSTTGGVTARGIKKGRHNQPHHHHIHQ